MKHQQIQSQPLQRAGFTLIELMVVILILMLIAGMTYSAINITADAERIGTGARQLQAYLEGARNRAVYAKEPRGVRFLPNPNDSSTSTSMVFIGPPALYTSNKVSINMSTREVTTAANWDNLFQRGLLVNGARIRIFDKYSTKSSHWYTLNLTPTTPTGTLTQAHLSRSFIVANTFTSASQGLSYELQLQPTVLPNQEPRQFAKGIVLDIGSSNPPNVKDILFAPNGTIYGTAAANGRIHYVLADQVDTAKNLSPGEGYLTDNFWAPSTSYNVGDRVRPTITTTFSLVCTNAGTSDSTEPVWPGNPNQGDTVNDSSVTWQVRVQREGEERIITVTTKTGAVTTYPVNQGTADPFKFAETGLGGS